MRKIFLKKAPADADTADTATDVVGCMQSIYLVENKNVTKKNYVPMVLVRVSFKQVVVAVVGCEMAVVLAVSYQRYH